MYQRC